MDRLTFKNRQRSSFYTRNRFLNPATVTKETRRFNPRNSASHLKRFEFPYCLIFPSYLTCSRTSFFSYDFPLWSRNAYDKELNCSVVCTAIRVLKDWTIFCFSCKFYIRQFEVLLRISVAHLLLLLLQLNRMREILRGVHDRTTTRSRVARQRLNTGSNTVLARTIPSHLVPAFPRRRCTVSKYHQPFLTEEYLHRAYRILSV